MITVRFPTGFSIQYNNLTHVKWGERVAHLYEKPDSQGWSVTVPKECVIEFVSPCRTYNPVNSGNDEVLSTVRQLTREVASLRRKLAKVTK